MTESEWLACTDPQMMLAFLRGKASDRKLRLFACACCRELDRGLVTSHPARTAVEVTEGYVDRAGCPEEMEVASRAAATASYTQAIQMSQEGHQELIQSGWRECWLARIARWASDIRFGGAAMRGAEAAVDQWFVSRIRPPAWDRVLACLFRDIFGNPFRPSPPLPPTVLARNDGIIHHIAQAIYEERKMPEGTLDPARLSILADALLDAGCDDDELIRHCRSEGPHVRGCWAVDLILGKE